MGLYAEIIAIGPFTEGLAEYLEYDATMYSETNEGSIVNMTLFGISEGTTLSREFANIFGITDARDFNQHKIVNNSIDFDLLEDFIRSYNHYKEDAITLKELNRNGFEFHFAPNG